MQKENDNENIIVVTAVALIVLLVASLIGLIGGNVYASNECRKQALDKGLPFLEIKELCR